MPFFILRGRRYGAMVDMDHEVYNTLEEVERRNKMTKVSTIKIDPEGNIFLLYDDNSFLKGEGPMQVERASNVEWDDAEQKWIVWLLPMEKGAERKRLKETFDSRMDAIAEEIRVLNINLEIGLDLGPLFEKGKSEVKDEDNLDDLMF
jgi:hypothetical protein